MSYYVEAYINRNEYIDNKHRFTLIFNSKEEFERIMREYDTFKDIFIESRYDCHSSNDDSSEDSDGTTIDINKTNGEIEYW